MLKDLFTLSGRWGRLNRLRYFWLWLLSIAGWLVTVFLLGLITFNADGNMAVTTAASFVFLIIPVYILFLWVQICLNAKRLHDLGFTGWLGVLPVGLTLTTSLITNPEPAVNVILLILNLVVLFFSLWILFAPGEAGENRFGPDPLDQ